MTKRLEQLRDELGKEYAESLPKIYNSDTNKLFARADFKQGFNTACEELLPVIKDMTEFIQKISADGPWFMKDEAFDLQMKARKVLGEE